MIQARYQVGDRVLLWRDVVYVPRGTRGIVVGIHGTSAEIYDVLFEGYQVPLRIHGGCLELEPQAVANSS